MTSGDKKTIAEMVGDGSGTPTEIVPTDDNWPPALQPPMAKPKPILAKELDATEAEKNFFNGDGSSDLPSEDEYSKDEEPKGKRNWLRIGILALLVAFILVALGYKLSGEPASVSVPATTAPVVIPAPAPSQPQTMDLSKCKNGSATVQGSTVYFNCP